MWTALRAELKGTSVMICKPCRVAGDYNLPSAHCGKCDCDHVGATNKPVRRIVCVCGRSVQILKPGCLRPHYVKGSDSEVCTEEWPPTV
jgi:hypothetical protein